MLHYNKRLDQLKNELIYSGTEHQFLTNLKKKYAGKNHIYVLNPLTLFFVLHNNTSLSFLVYRWPGYLLGLPMVDESRFRLSSSIVNRFIIVFVYPKLPQHALRTILTYIFHVTLSALFSIDGLEVKVFLLACFEISYAAGKYLVDHK